MKLVIFERDWADEFSPFGFAVMDKKEFEEFRKHHSKPRTWYFGTNEGFEDEVLFEDCEVKNITKKEAATLIKLFGGKALGLFPDMYVENDDEND